MMKKAALLLSLLALICAPVSFAQDVPVTASPIPSAPPDKQPVAVYMSGKEPPTARGSHKILGAELAKAITGSGKYTAVDRTDAILQQIAREHVYQRSGAVSDAEIKRLGAQFGVQFLCVAEVSQVKDGTFFLEARLVNIETAAVLEIAALNSALATGQEMVQAAQRIARVLMTGSSGDESAEEFNNRGRAMLNVDLDKAIVAFSGAILQEPGEAAYRVNRGYAYYRKELPDNAIIDYTEAIRLRPDEAEYFYNRGSVYLGKGDYANAISDFSEAINLKADDIRYFTGRGAAYHLKKDLDRAAADIEAALRIEPDNIDARGILKSVHEDQAKARAYADSLRAAEHSRRGHALLLNGDYDNAIAEYTEAILVLPGSAPYLNGRGVAYVSKGVYDSAVTDFTAAIRLDHDEVMYYYNRGSAYYTVKTYERAIADFQAVLRFEPGNDNVKSLLEAARKGMEARDAPPPPEEPVDKAPSAYASAHAGFQGASYNDGGAGSSGSYWGVGVAGLLRAEHTHKFGLVLGLGQSFNSARDGGYDYSLSSTSLYLQPLYRVGGKRRYFDAAFTMDIPLSQRLRVEEGGRTVRDEPVDADAAYSLDFSGRYDYFGLGLGLPLSGSAVRLNASLFWSLGGHLELVPALAYHWGDGWGAYSLSIGVVVSFW